MVVVLAQDHGGLSAFIRAPAVTTHLGYLPKARLPGDTGRSPRPATQDGTLFPQGPCGPEDGRSGGPGAKAEKRNEQRQRGRREKRSRALGSLVSQSSGGIWKLQGPTSLHSGCELQASGSRDISPSFSKGRQLAPSVAGDLTPRPHWGAAPEGAELGQPLLHAPSVPSVPHLRPHSPVW